MKKIIKMVALCLTLVLVVSSFSACGNGGLESELSFDIEYENTNSGGSANNRPNSSDNSDNSGDSVQTGNNQPGNNQAGNNPAGNNQAGNNQAGNNQAGNNQAGNNQAGNNQAGNNNNSNSASKLNGNVYTSGFPIVKKGVTLKILCNSMALHVNGFEDMAWNKDYEKKTGVNVEWQLMEGGQNEKIVSTLASGNLPDVIISYSAMRYSQMETYAKNGLLLSMSESDYKTYAPNAWNAINSTKGAKASMTLSDGKIYSMPNIRVDMNDYNKLFINKTWLDNLGLKSPTTYAEFLNVMEKFVKNDPNGNGVADEIGLVMTGADNLMTASPFGIEVSKKYDSMYVNGSGEVNYFPASDAFRKSMKFLNQLYEVGGLDWKSYSGAQTVNQRLATGKVGAFISLSVSSVPEKYINDYIYITPLKADKTTKAVSQTARGEETQSFSMIITSAAKKNQKKEIAMRWADYFFTPHGYFYKEFGPSGYYYTTNSDGTYTGTTETKNGKLVTKYTDSDRYQWAPGYVLPGWSKGSDELWKNPAGLTASVASVWKDKYGKAMTTAYEGMRTKNYISYGSLKFDTASEASITTYSGPLYQYVFNDTVPAFIQGSWDVDTNWSQYQAELERLGVLKLVKIYQNTYDKSK